MGKLYLGMASAAAGVMMMSSPAQAACGDVSITEMNWASSQIVTAVSKFIMEQGYGCKVTTIPSATTTAITSLAETNEPDIVTELWSNSAAAYPKLESEGKISKLADVLSDGGVEGWWIPTYLAEKHPELKTLAGVLANPQLVGGRFHNCPDGWGCRIANDNMVKAFGVSDAGVEIFNHGSGETLATSIAAAYSDKAPWFGYYWAPTAVLGKYAMTQVDVGPYNKEAHTCNQKKDCATPGKSSYPAAPVVTVVTSTFAAREPDVVALMKNVAFTNEQMGSLLAWKEETKASSEDAAVRFLTEYKDVWANWLSDDAKAKLAAVLK